METESAVEAENALEVNDAVMPLGAVKGKGMSVRPVAPNTMSSDELTRRIPPVIWSKIIAFN